LELLIHRKRSPFPHKGRLTSCNRAASAPKPIPRPNGRTQFAPTVYGQCVRIRRGRCPISNNYRNRHGVCHPEQELIKQLLLICRLASKFCGSRCNFAPSEQNRRAKSKDFARKGSPLSLNGLSKNKVTFIMERSFVPFGDPALVCYGKPKRFCIGCLWATSTEGSIAQDDTPNEICIN